MVDLTLEISLFASWHPLNLMLKISHCHLQPTLILHYWCLEFQLLIMLIGPQFTKFHNHWWEHLLLTFSFVQIKSKYLKANLLHQAQCLDEFWWTVILYHLMFQKLRIIHLSLASKALVPAQFLLVKSKKAIFHLFPQFHLNSLPQEEHYCLNLSFLLLPLFNSN